MTLRPEYSLGHSPYNAFLFAAVGEERVGVPLTVLSALTRLGLDPWQEATRLSALPRETAALALAKTIRMLPEGDWSSSEVGAVAARLVTWLPRHSHQVIPPMEAGTIGDINLQTGLARALVWGALVAALIFFSLYLASSNNPEVGPRMTHIDSAVRDRS
jgi:hypothetical protein